MNDEELDIFIANAEYEPQQLKDYITNLQEENGGYKQEREKLFRTIRELQKNNNFIKKDRNKLLRNYLHLIILLEDYKKKIEKVMKMNNEELNKIIMKAEDEYELLKDRVHDLYEENKNYKSRIDKAVKYYKTHQQECVIGRNRDEKLIKEYYLPAQCSKNLLNILTGGDEE